VGKSAATLSRLGLLGLALFAVGTQVPPPSFSGQSAGLLSLPARSLNTSSESNSEELLSGASRPKSIPRPDWPFALPATAGVPVRPGAGDPLTDKFISGFVHSPSHAHSGRAPPSA